MCTEAPEKESCAGYQSGLMLHARTEGLQLACQVLPKCLQAGACAQQLQRKRAVLAIRWARCCTQAGKTFTVTQQAKCSATTESRPLTQTAHTQELGGSVCAPSRRPGRAQLRRRPVPGAAAAQRAAERADEQARGDGERHQGPGLGHADAGAPGATKDVRQRQLEILSVPALVQSCIFTEAEAELLRL